ncbi:phenazine biosynthesis-like domain-containing protein isoform X2 [Alligator sinensis]|uniref:Phenazine biosynthesis-like domain-containing protein isoform X2 n=1 Tax=Alligator sinensis TaxID=38654 RepID=A0A1U8DVX0_ALLSI|nr:phenazine biosynthesis-like domain-containing protein isoform X2 [Alligator sinensis]
MHDGKTRSLDACAVGTAVSAHARSLPLDALLLSVSVGAAVAKDVTGGSALWPRPAPDTPPPRGRGSFQELGQLSTHLCDLHASAPVRGFINPGREVSRSWRVAGAMRVAVFIVDAFTAEPFGGNPAAVCLLHSDLDEDMHQKIATEMNLSETAFIRTLDTKDDFTKSSCFGLRWFTPTNEVPLCGHATLAAAAVLFNIQENMNSALTFVTLSGELKAKQEKDHIVLDLPLYSTYPQTAVGDMVVQDLRYSPDTKKLLVRLNDTYERSVLEKLKVNAQDLVPAEKTGKVKGLILTLKGSLSEKHKNYDFYSRYFAPWNGVLEDPVTGSAHAVLGSYWSQHLGKSEMLACQCSPRGGEMKISLQSDGRIDIAGQVVIVLTGNLTF